MQITKYPSKQVLKYWYNNIFTGR